MADPNRTTRSFAYAVEASAYGVRTTRSFAYAVEAEGAGVGLAPTIRVGNISSATADLMVDPLSEYLEVRFQTRQAGLVIDDVSQVGGTRYVRSLSGLPHSTAFVSRARVRRAAGWSPWSEVVDWATAAPGDPIGARGCPPDVLGYFQNPDSNPPSFLGRGWYHPLPGEPMRGVEVLVLRHNDPAWLWDIYLSDDYGATYSLISEDLGPSGIVDGDGLYHYRLELDTTALVDGMNYRLKAVSAIPGDDEEYESLTFPIDNTEEDDPERVQYWDNRQDPAGRFGKLWAQLGSSHLFGVRDETIWVHGRDGGLAALANHDWAMLVDSLVPLCKGGDVTLRFYIWSGEGGIFSLQGRDDTEGWHAGPGFFASGESTEDKVGLVAEMTNPRTWPLGCCDDVYTSTSAGANVGIPAGSDSLGILNIEGGGITQAIAAITKMYFKAVKWPHFLSKALLGSWRGATWRDGAFPGEYPVASGRSCGRRYEMYAMRVRVEEDPGDDTRIRVRKRIDGDGIPEPESGYWHLDEWCTLDEPLECGALGMVSQQTTSDLYAGAVYGARVFLGWSAKPIDVCGENDIPPTELPRWNPPVEGAPCSLILQVFDTDRQTVAWEVGTDEDHPEPYLALPAHYGEQEVDVVNGSASIGQVEVAVVDRRRTEGDQDSGLITSRLVENGVSAVHGRRCRLIRFISPELGWVVIADGPASVPILDESYSAYRWTIRDTRETERKQRAFVETDTSWLVPMGVEDGWGEYVDKDGADQWLVPPTEPLAGEFQYFESSIGNPDEGFVNLTEHWDGAPNITPGAPPNPILDPRVLITSEVENALVAEVEFLGSPYPVRFTWPNLRVLWREEGSGDPWTVVEPEYYIYEGQTWSLARAAGGKWFHPLAAVADAEYEDDGDLRGVYSVLLRGNDAEGDFPADNTRVEVAIQYVGEPTPFAPLHLEYKPDGSRLTIGELIRDLYDGLYSDVDADGEVVPTAIRYDEESLLEMDEPVLLRITEPVPDLRDWTEKYGYAPTGWFPALDNDGRISPLSQVPPEPFVGELEVDDAITEPVPDWDAGERIVNHLAFVYPRYYRVEIGDADSIDLLKTREVEQRFLDPDSIDRLEESRVELRGEAFSAIGDIYQRPVLAVDDEAAYALALDRKLYVFDRFKNGAVTIEVPVMRSLHVHVPELLEHHSATLRAGSWVTVYLSWLPDYVTRKRGLQMNGQVIAVNDVDCAWRVLLIEEVLPILDDS